MCSMTLLAGLMLSTGCATHVVPPARVSEPITVYYADYGVHSALIIPKLSEPKYIEYVFGDYAFSVENKTDPFHTLGALLTSFKSALGRREHLMPPPVAPVPNPPPHKMIAFEVERSKVVELLAKLDARYRSSPGPAINNPWNNVDYVPDSVHYSILNSCNTLTKENLKALGCDVSGVPILPNFRFAKK